MSLSVVNFRMHHGNISEQIAFSGNGIKLLDLKKEILDKKKISGSLDFDLKIVDEDGKGIKIIVQNIIYLKLLFLIQIPIFVIFCYLSSQIIVKFLMLSIFSIC